jgi:hypothetical protein
VSPRIGRRLAVGFWTGVSMLSRILGRDGEFSFVALYFPPSNTDLSGVAIAIPLLYGDDLDNKI